jgi:hypothetical protein
VSLRDYRFCAGGGEDHWQSVQRLHDEVGWTLDFDEATVARLRSTTEPQSVSRARMTRREFVDSLIAKED